jgi:hypothetical protein
MKVLKFFLIFFMILSTTEGTADVPGEIGFQGYLFTEDGSPETGTVSMEFSFFDSESGGNNLGWTESRDIEVDQGMFSIFLGEVTPINPLLFTGGKAYLEVKIEGEVMDKRLEIASTIYCFTAQTALNVPSPDDIKSMISDEGFIKGKCSSGQILKWDGTKWSCDEDKSGGSYTAGYGITISPEGKIGIKDETVQTSAKLVCYDLKDELVGVLNDVYSPVSHNHDNLYYPKQYFDQQIQFKSDITHNHNDSYAFKVHSHDDLYYGKNAADTQLSLKSDKTHNHDLNYAALIHNHEGIYSSVSHNHDMAYSLLSHNHNSEYASLVHNHDSLYYGKAAIDDKFLTKSDASHDHDGSYALIEHNHDTKYAGSSHNHDGSGITSGIIAVARLDEAVSLLGQSIEGDEISNNTILLSKIAQTDCEDGQVIKWSDTENQWVCGEDSGGTSGSYTEGTGIIISGWTISANKTTIQGWSRDACFDTQTELTTSLNSVYAPINHNHPVDHNHNSLYASLLHNHDAADIVSGKIANERLNDDVSILGQAIEGTEIAPKTITFANMAQNDCENGYVMKWSDTDNMWICAKDNVGAGGGSYMQGEGIIISEDTISADGTVIKEWAKEVCYDNETELTDILKNFYAPVDHNHTGTYSPEGHSHDDNYYTRTEVDKLNNDLTDLIAQKADSSHTHDEYLSDAEAATLFNETKNYIDEQDALKADKIHNHDDYAAKDHNHDDKYLNSSEDDGFTSGTLTFFPGTNLVVNGSVTGSAFTDWDTDKNNDLTSATNFAGDVEGYYNTLNITQNAVGTLELADNSVTGVKILDGTITFDDLGQYCAPNKVIRRNAEGTAWECGDAVSGTVVTEVTASAPLASTGGTKPDISLTGVVPLANGGTGSSTKNFVDLTTDQTIAGTKSFSGNVGIGTTLPEFKLSLDNDGGIFAKGAIGYGRTLGTSYAGTSLIWYPRKAAFRAGNADGNQWSDSNTGMYSAASGFNTLASGPYSAAMGNQTTASESSSTAMGYLTTANAPYSTAMGYYSTASGNSSTAIGNNTTASGAFSFAAGYKATASAENSLAMGYRISALQNYSTAIGRDVVVDAQDSVVIGHGYSNLAQIYNNRQDSLMVGFNSNIPTFYVGPGDYGVTGNVGIGTVNPAEKFEVYGKVKATGFIGDGSQITGIIANNADTVDGKHAADFAEFTHNHSTYALSNHDHDSLYYQKAYVDAQLLLKADNLHNHDDYSTTDHNHDAKYSSVSHNHEHNHDGSYSLLTHNHYLDYAPLSHNHTEYALLLHNHDASEITDGTLDNSRLSSDVSLLGETIDGSEIEDSTIMFSNLNQNECSDGDLIQWSDSDGWQCGTVSGGTTYTEGDGIDIISDTISVEQTTIQDWAKLVCFSTETELTSLLDDDYAPFTHAHDYAASLHTHDTLYYQKAEVDNKIDTAVAAKADLNHNHSNYAAGDHNHTGTYAEFSHNHDIKYIINGTSEQQTAGFNITGKGLFGTSVGIGTLDPKAILHVVSDSSIDGMVRLQRMNSSGEATIGFSSYTGTPDCLIAGKCWVAGAGAWSLNDSFVIGTKDPLLIIAPSGNTGIGTTAPSARLQVSGTVKATAFAGDGSGITGIVASNSDKLDEYHATDFALFGHTHGTLYSPIGHDHAGIYSLASHLHTDLYSPLGHTHSGYSLTNHDHNDSYYLKKDVYSSLEVDLKLAAKSDTGHNHNLNYEPLGHNHDTNYIINGTSLQTADFNISGNGYIGGNLGIGTTNPASKLDMRGANVNDSGVFQLGNSNLSHYLGLYGGDQSEPNPSVFWKAGDPLRFGTDEGTWSEKMRITTGGNVGIGTTVPAARLHVNGTITATGGSSTSWNTAYGWGNHATAGYLLSESDPEVGTNTLNYMPKWDGSQLVKGTIYDNGNVGIGTPDPKSQIQVEGGDVYISSGGKGIVLRSPNGTACLLLRIDDSGTLLQTPISCP